jgi:hypothetical protein
VKREEEQVRWQSRFTLHASLFTPFLSLRLFATTLTELTAIAAAAIAGVRRMPKAG